MYSIISPFSSTFDGVGLLYFIPDFLRESIKKGQVVSIPLKDKIEVGVVLEMVEKPEDYISIASLDKVKSIIDIMYPEALIDEKRIELVKHISDYYFTTIHSSLNLFFPANIRAKLRTGNFKLEDSDETYSYSFNHDVVLTSGQQRVYDEISKSKEEKFLIYGVTGSGKTEIYINMMKDYLDKGQQVLFLVPEIILNNQIGNRIIKVFGEDVIVINSSVTGSKKEKYWKDIYHGKAKIIVGTRSSIFYPYKNLGLTIIDEEHDNSYLSDKSPRYNTVEVSEQISERYGSRLILASGTPSIVSMTKAVKGEYKLLNLLDKYK